MDVDRRQFIETGLTAGLLSACGLPTTASTEGGGGPAWHAGYRTAPAEGFDASPMRLVQGKAPTGLEGTLYRNGPAQFHYGNTHASHWFDGDGMIQRVHVEDGMAIHSGKFVETTKRTAEQAADRFLADGFGTKGDPSYPVQSSDDVNAANTSVVMAGGELLALWEAGSPWRLDPETLESRGPKVWRDDLKGMPYLAHPKIEPDGRIWNLGVNGTRIAIYLAGADGELIDFGLTDMGVPAYLHDWAMTDRHLVILVQPWLRTRMIPPFVDSLEWHPEDGLKILIVDKDDFSKTRWAQAPARAFFHTGAAWEEDDGTIKLDVAFYDEPILGSGGGASEIKGTWTVAERPPYQSKFSLLVIPPKGDARIIETALDGDFPQVDPRRHGLNRHLSALVTGVSDRHPGNTTLSVHDWDTGETDAFDFGSTRIAEEFLFAPKPGSSAERDSWLIGPVLNIKAQTREIHVFDARKVSDGPVCTWMADYTWPLGFHGMWA
ncbi:MAG: carotenoid oxygenase family protein [Pseudomonadota bacterium]